MLINADKSNSSTSKSYIKNLPFFWDAIQNQEQFKLFYTDTIGLEELRKISDELWYILNPKGIKTISIKEKDQTTIKKGGHESLTLKPLSAWITANQNKDIEGIEKIINTLPKLKEFLDDHEYHPCIVSWLLKKNSPNLNKAQFESLFNDNNVNWRILISKACQYDINVEENWENIQKLDAEKFLIAITKLEKAHILTKENFLGILNSTSFQEKIVSYENNEELNHKIVALAHLENSIKNNHYNAKYSDLYNSAATVYDANLDQPTSQLFSSTIHEIANKISETKSKNQLHLDTPTIDKLKDIKESSLHKDGNKLYNSEFAIKFDKFLNAISNALETIYEDFQQVLLSFENNLYTDTAYIGYELFNKDKKEQKERNYTFEEDKKTKMIFFSTEETNKIHKFSKALFR